MEQKAEKFTAWLDERIASCVEKQRMLLADDRRDEAVFEKVRGNVYDIFRTVFAVAAKNSGGDAETVRRFFTLKTEQIPASWADAYDAAKQHGDTERMVLERIKLDAIGEIRTVFSGVWGGSACVRRRQSACSSAWRTNPGCKY